jgi:transposase
MAKLTVSKVRLETEREVVRLYRQGMSIVGIAEQVGIGSRTVQRILQKPRQSGCIVWREMPL